MPHIQITPHGNSTEAANSATRLAALVASALTDRDSIKQCVGELFLRLDSTPEKIVYSGTFHGMADGKDFSFDINSELFIGDSGRDAFRFAMNPMFAMIAFVARSFTQDNDRNKQIDNLQTRTEFDIASKLEKNILKHIGVQLPEEASILPKTLIVAAICFVVAGSCLAFLNLQRQDIFRDVGPVAKFFLSLMIGAIFGIPAGIGGLFLGLSLFFNREAADTLSGQSVLRLVGAKSVSGMRWISVFGVVVGFGLFAGIFRMCWNKL